MIEYYDYYPKNFLKEYIHKFWFVKGHIGYKLEKILPMPYIFLIVNLGEKYKLFNGIDIQNYEFKVGAWISGLQNKFIMIENPEITHNIGIEFYPGSVSCFTNLHQVNLTNKVQDTNLVFENDFTSLITKSNTGSSAEELFIELEKVLESLFKENLDKNFNIIKDSIKILDKDNGIKISDLAEQFGISKKHLTFLYEKYIGISPKKLKDLYKFHKIIEQIGSTKPSSWAEFSVRFNYHDQAHFTKVFKMFTGFTPNEYIEIMNKYGSGYLNFVALDKSNR